MMKFIIVLILMFAGSAHLEVKNAQKPLIIGIDSDTNSYSGKWALLVYTEAFKRLKLSFEFRILPLKRIEISAAEGIIDIEGGRTYEYGEGHKYLIRVDQPLVNLSFNLYSADPYFKLNNLNEIATRKLSVEYRRGIKICENALAKYFPDKSLNDLTETEHGIKKLISKRMDLFCDIDTNVLTYLHSPDFPQENIKLIKKVFSLKKDVPIYPYVINKHADLALKLKKVLKDMQAEGLIEKYRLKVEKELGYTSK